ncbi:MAG TPA: hypothetical protein VJQ52_19955 [Steroidobacteraceae bacterium]|nr:hypothetical protein [Steroidobacteraceae bacterium]
MTSLVSHRLVRAGVLASAIGSIFASGGAQAAEWLFAPTARMSTAYADNPRLQEDGGTSTTAYLGELGGELQRRTERSSLKLQPQLRSSRYSEDDSLDSDDQYLNTSASYLTQRAQWDASLNLGRDTTLTSELASTGLVQTNRRHESAALNVGATFMSTDVSHYGAQLYLLDSRYVDAVGTGLVDYRYRSVSPFWQGSATERSDVTITAQIGELFVPVFESRTRDASLRLAWSTRPAELWTTKLSAGPAYVNSSSGEDSGVVFDADLERRGERWRVTANAGRNLTPTGRGVLTRRDRVMLGVNRRVSEFVSASATMQWTRNQDLLPQAGIAFTDVEYGRVDVNLNWRISEHWSVGLALAAATQNNEASAGSADYQRASLSILWNGQQQAL